MKEGAAEELPYVSTARVRRRGLRGGPEAEPGSDANNQAHVFPITGRKDGKHRGPNESFGFISEDTALNMSFIAARVLPSVPAWEYGGTRAYFCSLSWQQGLGPGIRMKTVRLSLPALPICCSPCFSGAWLFWHQKGEFFQCHQVHPWIYGKLEVVLSIAHL